MAQNLSQGFSSVFTRDYAGKLPSVNTRVKNVNQIRGMKFKKSPLGVHGIPSVFLVETIEQTSIL